MLFGLAVSMSCSDGASSGGPLTPFTPVNPVVPPPAPQNPPPPPTPRGPPPAFPAVSSDATIYNGPDNLYDFFISNHGSSLPTRYVFFRDSTFHLQFASFRFGVFTYTGRYSQADSLITFSWDGTYAGAPWASTGTLRGDILTIRYNMNMVMSDFIDGDYVRSR